MAIQLKKRLVEQTTKTKALEESRQKLLAEKEDLITKGTGLASRNIQVSWIYIKKNINNIFELLIKL